MMKLPINILIAVISVLHNDCSHLKLKNNFIRVQDLYFDD